MLKLDLHGRAVTRLPASEFPDRADVYVCDKCERDITEHLRPHHPHTWTPTGPERYVCPCGEKYLTGAIEWDHLGDSERRRRVRDTIGLGVVFSAFSLILAIPICFILRLISPALGVVVGIAICAAPFALLQITFWPGVIASVWRTRIATPRRGTGSH
jgi:hypothetical protein